jgi:hypothetical protein
MSIQQQKSDYEAILWAWRIIKEHGVPEDNEEYWKTLISSVAEKRNESDIYNELGIAIINIMEHRLVEQRRSNGHRRNN